MGPAPESHLSPPGRLQGGCAFTVTACSNVPEYEPLCSHHRLVSSGDSEHGTRRTRSRQPVTRTRFRLNRWDTSRSRNNFSRRLSAPSSRADFHYSSGGSSCRVSIGVRSHLSFRDDREEGASIRRAGKYEKKKEREDLACSGNRPPPRPSNARSD